MNLLFSQFTVVFCLITSIAFSQSPFSCGTNADPSDYQAALDFLNTNHVAGTWNSEISVPLHIIYVNEDDGTPPAQIVRISEFVNVANQIFDSIANVYVCGYHHINNSNFSNLNWLTERIPLYDYYHLDEVINVYIVSNLDVGGGVAPLPNHPKNNMMIMASETNMYTLAHELGHNFGLFHTHQGNNYIPSTGFCNLVDPNVNPLTTGDLVEDTPVDPSPFLPNTDTVCLDPIGCHRQYYFRIS